MASTAAGSSAATASRRRSCAQLAELRPHRLAQLGRLLHPPPDGHRQRHQQLRVFHVRHQPEPLRGRHVADRLGRFAVGAGLHRGLELPQHVVTFLAEMLDSDRIAHRPNAAAACRPAARLPAVARGLGIAPGEHVKCRAQVAAQGKLENGISENLSQYRVSRQNSATSSHRPAWTNS